MYVPMSSIEIELNVYLSVVEFIMADVGAAVHGLVPVDQDGEGARWPRLEVGDGSRHIQLFLRRDLEITNKLLYPPTCISCCGIIFSLYCTMRERRTLDFVQ